MPGKHEKTIRFHGRFSAAAIFTGAAPNKSACDLGKAYPAEAGVKNFVRTLVFSRHQWSSKTKSNYRNGRICK